MFFTKILTAIFIILISLPIIWLVFLPVRDILLNSDFSHWYFILFGLAYFIVPAIIIGKIDDKFDGFNK